ncbi:MAG: hypothetical protein E3J87_05995 [Candidatus Cloacimonadota bacterium]|nr:MAG: hypothetical protein E3J87_05995 [Candidatus Cloacimonadota bacterium]
MGSFEIIIDNNDKRLYIIIEIKMEDFKKLFIIGLSISFLTGNLFAQSKPFWKKLKYGFEYKGGICWGGNYLKSAQSSKCITSLDSWYGINSIEGSVFFPQSNDKYIKVGFDYGWANLSNIAGVPDKIMESPYEWYYLLYTASDEWQIRKYSINIERITKSYISFGLEIAYSEGKTTEFLYMSDIQEYNWTLFESALVTRKCFGGGAFIKFQWQRRLTNNIHINPFVITKISAVSEISNNVPWPYSREGILKIHYSGIYAGMNLTFGDY